MYRYLQRLSKYEAISFTTGFALMTYELAAARILAPSIGSSTYVWTSVIGVIIAALSLGYAAGGKVADARVKPLDVAWLLLASGFGVAITLILAPSLLAVLAESSADPRLQGLFASLILFAPASFILGMISPYLVRLRVASLETSGESVALLSALNSIGGIIGTFAAGFIFFGFIGSRETVIIVTAILLISSWLVLPKTKLRQRLIATAIVITISLLPFLTTPRRDGLVTTIDTPSANYQVFDGQYGNEPVRFLSTGPTGFQSGVYQDGRDELVFRYTQKIAEIITEMPRKNSVLILGGGAFTLPEYLALEYPGMQVDVVEIDPNLEDISTQYFGYSRPDNITAYTEDARVFLNKNEKQYDAIVVDVYSDTAIPFSLATQEYVQEAVKSLQSSGIVIANIIGANSESCAPMFGALHTAYTQKLPDSALFAMVEPTLQQRQNIIAVYGKSLDWLDKTGESDVAIAKRQPFTDNFAPAERLHQQCRHI